LLGAEDLEKDAQNQRIVLMVNKSGHGQVLNWRVRIIGHDYDEEENGWMVHYTTYDTKTSRTDVTVTGLVAGAYYAFQVAAVNEVDEGPYSDVFPSRDGMPIGVRTVKIEAKVPPTVAQSDSTEDPLTCSTVASQGDLENRAPNWLMWPIKVTVSALPPSQERPGAVFFTPASGEAFECTRFENDPTDKLVAYCDLPCDEQTTTTELKVEVWDANQLTRIAEGELTHEPASGETCGLYRPGTPIFCDVQDKKRRGCMPLLRANGTGQCSSCKDAVTTETYDIGDNTCSGNKCAEGTTWCQNAQGSLCIAVSCKEGCDPQSMETSGRDGVACSFSCLMKDLIQALIPCLAI
jgi:hypothetical protein